MADWKITYNDKFVMSPMTPWVHRRVSGEEGAPAAYDPPRPLQIPGKGYATFRVTVERFPFTFASLHELDEAIRVLEEPVLPAVATPERKRLPVYRRLDPHGASERHWTARLPKQMQGWARRRKIVGQLRDSRAAIVKALGPANAARAYGRDPAQADDSSRGPDTHQE
jgi:hypothetical protein